jgi:hypothetical protein
MPQDRQSLKTLEELDSDTTVRWRWTAQTPHSLPGIRGCTRRGATMSSDARHRPRGGEGANRYDGYAGTFQSSKTLRIFFSENDDRPEQNRVAAVCSNCAALRVAGAPGSIRKRQVRVLSKMKNGEDCAGKQGCQPSENRPSLTQRTPLPESWFAMQDAYDLRVARQHVNVQRVGMLKLDSA